MKKLKYFYILLCVFLLSGCKTSTIHEDFTETYKGFLDYTLGNWEVTNKEEKEIATDRQFGFTTKFYEWTIDYQDYGGNLQTLKINNYDHISWSLREHLNDRYISMLTKEIPELDNENADIYIHDVWVSLDTRNARAYAQNPNLFYKNYKDIYNFQDLTLTGIYEHSPLHLRIGLDYSENANMPMNDRIRTINNIEQKILALLPNVNLMFEGMIDEDNENTIIHNYINGQKVRAANLNEYQEMLRNTVPQYDISDLAED